MKCVIPDRFYTHRNVLIMKDEQGISTSLDLKLFPTFADARQYIDQSLDHTNTREPKIIGAWTEKGVKPLEKAR